MRSIEVALVEGERLTDPQAGAPEQHDQHSKPLASARSLSVGMTATISSTVDGSSFGDKWMPATGVPTDLKRREIGGYEDADGTVVGDLLFSHLAYRRPVVISESVWRPP